MHSKQERRRLPPASGAALPQTTNPSVQKGEGVGGIQPASSPPHVQLGALDKPGHASPLQKGWDGSPGGRGRPPPRPFSRRTLTGTPRNCNASFKSPVPSPGPCLPPDKDALQQEMEVLKNTQVALDEEIAQLLAEGYSLEELEDHIALLHEYNEIKDVGQMLLGRLALIRGVTTKELYPEFGLDLTD